MKALLNNFRQTPRKVRAVADLIKGKKVDEAFMILKGVVRSASNPLQKLLKSAVANAKGVDAKNLFVKSVVVNGGTVMKRIMPRARGSAYRIKKRTSHIDLVLEERK